MNKKRRQQIERVLALADTTLEELAVAIHQRGFTAVVIYLDENGLVDKAELVDKLSYIINPRVGWETIFFCGLKIIVANKENE